MYLTLSTAHPSNDQNPNVHEISLVCESDTQLLITLADMTM